MKKHLNLILLTLVFLNIQCKKEEVLVNNKVSTKYQPIGYRAIIDTDELSKISAVVLVTYTYFPEQNNTNKLTKIFYRSIDNLTDTLMMRSSMPGFKDSSHVGVTYYTEFNVVYKDEFRDGRSDCFNNSYWKQPKDSVESIADTIITIRIPQDTLISCRYDWTSEQPIHTVCEGYKPCSKY